VWQKDRAHEWKCQPNHWLSPALERHEIIVGAFSVTVGAIVSATLACWVINDGYTTLYFNPGEYGWFWLLVQTPVTFIFQVSLITIYDAFF
jgi:lathosterol oxidase